MKFYGLKMNGDRNFLKAVWITALVALILTSLVLLFACG